MNIAILGTRGIPANYGGFETSAEETAIRISAKGHRVTVFSRRRPTKEERARLKNIEIIYLPTLPSKNFGTVFHTILSSLYVVLRCRDLDVVHMYNAASSFGGVIIKLSGTRLVITLDGIEWNRENWGYLAKATWRLATWLAVRISDICVCDSDVVKKHFESMYDKSIQYIPYGAKVLTNKDKLEPKFCIQEQEYYIFVGRFVKEKDLETLIYAYNQSKKRFPLVLIGDNENDQRYVEFLKEIADERIVFLGYRYGAEYESLLSNARAYVSASKLEGTSPSLLAAMGAGVCCLVNSIAENRETGKDSVLYFDGSISDLTQKLETIADDDFLTTSYARRGLIRVKEYYSWDVVTAAYLSCYLN